MHIIFRIVCIGRVYNRKCFHGSLVWLRIENDRFDIIANKQPQLFFIESGENVYAQKYYNVTQMIKFENCLYNFIQSFTLLIF